MENQERINLLISIQEHPEQYTDEQLQQLIADNPELEEQLEQIALTKQAFIKREADEEDVPVEEEWQKFYAEHSDEIEVLGKNDCGRTHIVPLKRMMGRLPFKVAASMVGILLMTGITFAAIHMVRMVRSPKPQTAQAEQTTSIKPTVALPLDTIKTDTITTIKPVVFDNVPLEKMLPQIAAHYEKEVEFQNAESRQLRFYFVWKQDETLEVVLHRLNLFESITVELNDNKIVVE